MNDVISAFLDNEPFDAGELSDALATREGRALLVDIIAMRSLMAAGEQSTAIAPPTNQRARPWHWAAAAALVATAAGFGLGRVTAPSSAPVPTPTSVFTFEPGVNWSDVTQGGD